MVSGSRPILLTVLPAVLVAGPLTVAPAQAAQEDLVRIGFGDATPGDPILTVANDAGTATTESVLTRAGGQIVARRPAVLDSVVAVFPAFDGRRTGTRAVIAVTNATQTDVLEPGAAAFRVGATVRMRTKTTGTRFDNGNNVIQRGRAGDAAQIKLEVDGRRPACRVTGAQGTLRVVASERIAPRRWYRLKCRRMVDAQRGDRLRLKVTRVTRSGTSSTVSTSGYARLGPVDFPLRVPLSIGGKLDDARTLAASTDQFNGAIDAAFLRVTTGG